MLQRLSYSDLLLLVLFIASIFLIVLGADDPFARQKLCAVFCPRSDHADFINKLAYDLGIAAVISLMFYVLLVRVPEEQKRSRLKRNLVHQYKMFKESCISIFLSAANGFYDPDEVTPLLDQSKFRAYFAGEENDHNRKWYDALNNLEEGNLRELQSASEVFRDDVLFVLNNIDVRDEHAFSSFRRFSHIVFELRSVDVNDDSMKRLYHFYYELLTGYSQIDGFRKDDFIMSIIDAI